jgi:formylglycine-generating enzyme required for sulfatase activity
MAGNVWEWVADWYDVYPGGDPNSSSGFGQKYRVLRGGSWHYYDNLVRSAYRGRSNPSDTLDDFGFRCARSPSATSAPPTSTPLPPTATNLPPTLTNTPAPPTATRGIVQTLTGNDGMTLLYVPAGEFTMGSDNGDFTAKPAHTVHLNAYWIDQTEVTNAMYAKCVADGICKEPTNNSSYTYPSYYGNPEFDNYPVIHVDWNMAKTYCEWAGRRLPTEAEWEKAARGENASVYPWGDTFDGSLVNFCDTNCPFDDWANKSFNDGFADVAPVGSYPSGKSVYGALDMAGNVMEWVSSLDKPYPYDATDGRENLDSSDARLVRGGSWGNRDRHVRSALGGWQDPSNTDYVIGFRCSRSP